MIYRFIYIRPSIHRSMYWVVYFISTQYPSNGLVWWGIIQYCKQYISSLLISLDWYIIQMAAWDDWGRYIYITIKWLGYPCKARYRHDTSCVHNQQLCVDKLPEIRELLVSLQSTHFGKLKADNIEDDDIWYVFICMTYYHMCLVFTKHQVWNTCRR